MTVTSINARRCGRCGGEGTRRKVEHHGAHVATIGACDSCIEKTAGELSAVRPVFDAMVAAGVSSEHANETMTFLLNLHYADTPKGPTK